MNYERAFLALILVMGVASATLSSASYTTSSVHQGLAGGNLTCPDYEGRTTTTYQQPGNLNGTSASYYGNIGWFETNITVNITPGVYNPYNATINSITNATIGHTFTINASVTDKDGATNIAATNISVTTGVCLQTSNSSFGNIFYVIYVCDASGPATADFVVGFTDNEAMYNETNSSGNAFPDHPASLGQPSITPNPAGANSTLTCNPGIWSDIDSDAEDEAARTWAWFLDGTDLNITNQTLGPGNFSIGDNITCNETAIAISWTTSNATNTSNNITIQNVSLGIEMLYPINGSTFGPVQCSFTGPPNITFSLGSTDRRVACSLYLNGIFYNNQTKNLTLSGPTNVTFTGLVVPGNYSMTCFASDSSGISPTSTAWANLYAMTGCVIPNLGVMIKNTTLTGTIKYSALTLPYFDVGQISAMFILGLAVYGMFHYVMMTPAATRW